MGRAMPDANSTAATMANASATATQYTVARIISSTEAKARFSGFCTITATFDAAGATVPRTFTPRSSCTFQP